MITIIAHRARNILRLAIQWTREGGEFIRHNRSVAVRLRAFTKLTRKLINRCSGRETLVDDHSLQVDFDCNFDDGTDLGEGEMVYFDCDEYFTFRDEDEMSEQPHFDGEDEATNGDFVFTYLNEDEIREELDYEGEDDGMNGDPDIDSKADEFIAMFHEHLRLERQRSIERERHELGMERGETSSAHHI